MRYSRMSGTPGLTLQQDLLRSDFHKRFMVSLNSTIIGRSWIKLTLPSPNMSDKFSFLAQVKNGQANPAPADWLPMHGPPDGRLTDGSRTSQVQRPKATSKLPQAPLPRKTGRNTALRPSNSHIHMVYRTFVALLAFDFTRGPDGVAPGLRGRSWASKDRCTYRTRIDHTHSHG
jgi:hypothetical protein